MPQKRLFLGIPVPDSFKEAHKELLKRLRKDADKKKMEVQWVPFESLHLTLKFLGETSEEKIEKVAEVMEEFKGFGEFNIKIEGMGAFPDITQSRVIWLNAQAKRELVNLQSTLEKRLQSLGFAEEMREFYPHITVGRLRKARKTRDFLSPVIRKKFPKIEISHLVLYESKMQGYHPVYTPLVKVTL